MQPNKPSIEHEGIYMNPEFICQAIPCPSIAEEMAASNGTVPENDDSSTHDAYIVEKLQDQPDDWLQAALDLREICKIIGGTINVKKQLCPDDLNQACIIVDSNSIEKIEDEVIFKATIFPGDEKQQFTVWGRVAKVNRRVAAEFLGWLTAIKNKRDKPFMKFITQIVQISDDYAAYYTTEEEIVRKRSVKEAIDASKE